MQEQRGQHSGQQRDRADDRGIDLCEAGDKALGLRFVGRSVLDRVQNAGDHGLAQLVGDADVDRTRGVHTARGDRVARTDGDRNRLACDRGGVDLAFARSDHAVERDAVARANQNDVARLGLLGGDG